MSRRINAGRDLFAKKRHEIQIIGGVAIDFFEALKEDKSKNLKSATILTYNVNLSMGYRYYITTDFFLGLRAKYNVIDYTLGNMIRLTGNTITIQFIIGGFEANSKTRTLEALGYKFRR